MKDKDSRLLWEAYNTETRMPYGKQDGIPGGNNSDGSKYETGEDLHDRRRKEAKERKAKESDSDSEVLDEESSNDVHYVEWLKKHSTEQGEWGPIGMEGVISHPFEETYAEYVNQSGLTDPYRAAQAHMKIAETGDTEGYKFYHEVDLQALENWKHHGRSEVHGTPDEDDPKRDGPGYDPDGNPIDDRDDAEDDPGEGWQKRASAAGQKFRDSGGKMFVDDDEEDDEDEDKDSR